MTEKKIQAVVFDLGDTILNFGKVDAKALFKEGGKKAHQLLKDLGQPVGELKPFLVRHLLTIRAMNLWSNIIKRDFDSLEILKKINTKKGVKLTDTQWQDFAWCWYEPLAKCAKIETDLKETLSKIKQTGAKIGLLSNTFINKTTLEKHLAQLDILKFFDAKLYSYQFKFRKPNKKIFIEAAKKLNCNPSNILFVGDRVDTDIIGALGANMLAAIKETYTNTLAKIPKDVIKIEKLAELVEIVKF
ncbi:MAG: HAD family hydrolase [Sedimentisphaerales bacterium]|nr:HAD family hydrolase [Sedimentisphaerales bacterium]